MELKVSSQMFYAIQSVIMLLGSDPFEVMIEQNLQGTRTV